jgi:hypothetical protein
MSINQITTSNTFGQLITAVAAMIAVANNLTDGPQVSSNAAWTYTNPGVGINVGNTALIQTANIQFINSGFANIVSGNIIRSNTSTANITTANIVGATITNIISTDHLSANANISGLLQVSDRMNVFSANIQSANIGALSITTLSAASLTVPVLNASFANITTLSVTGTSQHLAIVATLVTTDNCNVVRLNATTANITGMSFGTMNTGFSNTISANIVSMNVGFANVVSENVLSSNIALLNVSNSFFSTMNASFANITSFFANTGNILSCNIASGNVTGRLNVASNPTSNLEVSTKAYTDIAANVLQQLLTSKGDIFVASAAANAIRLGVGTNGQSLIVDTQTTSSLRWTARGPVQTFRGLSLQTSVTDFARSNANNIILEHVDEIVMDDGEVVTGWTDKSMIINTANASGNIGGLDTGSMIANTWYELYAIRKRVDGTKGFIIHRALDRYVDQNTAGVAQFAHNITVQVNKVTTPNVRVAQSFVANVSGPLTSFEVRMFKTGTPTGNVWINLHANTAGDPGATPLASSRKYDVARVALTTHYPIRFVFDSTANVVAGTSYFGVAQTDFTASDTAFITLEGSTTAYFNGVTKGYTGAAWVTLAPGVGTLIFREYVESNSTSLVYPAGYDQKCLVSYVATDALGKLKEFTQRERTISCPLNYQWAGYAALATEKEVADLNFVVPPVQCMVAFMFVSSGINSMAAGRFYATDLVAAVAESPGGGGVFYGATAGGTTPSTWAPMWVEHQGINLRSPSVPCKAYPVNITF